MRERFEVYVKESILPFLVVEAWLLKEVGP
jgi:hypothetical protein